jgi:hypothetical protein
LVSWRCRVFARVRIGAIEEGGRGEERIIEEYGLLISCRVRHTIPPRWSPEIAANRHQAKLPEKPRNIAFPRQIGKLINAWLAQRTRSWHTPRISHGTTTSKQHLEATQRKAQIATYHLSRFEELLDPTPPPQQLSIPMQAHFEGVVVATMAAVDQVVQAAKSVLKFKLGKNDDLVNKAFETLSSSLPQIGDWFGDPIGRDLRSIRTKMVHYAYRKTTNSPRLQWEVQRAATQQQEGSRELTAYARAAVSYIDRLTSFLPAIERLFYREGAPEKKA